MSNGLDLKSFKNGEKVVNVGKLNNEVIQLLKLNRDECNILIWADRIKYIEKHKKDFENEEEYYRHLSRIPEIIKNPDYLRINTNDNSIQFIKRINELMLVGVRVKDEGNLNVRTAYPITQDKLDYYSKNNSLIIVESVDKIA